MRYIEIKACDRCPCRDLAGNNRDSGWSCFATVDRRRLDEDMSGIPDWCPLPSQEPQPPQFKTSQAMQIDDKLLKHADLWLWMGRGGDWEVEPKVCGVIVFPDGRGGRKLVGRPGDWVIRKADGSLTIARSPAETVYYHVYYEIDYTESTTILVTEDFEQAKTAFGAEYDYISADRKLIDTWQNGKCVSSRKFPLEDE